MTEKSKKRSSGGVLKEYGAYLAGFLGALGALGFAVLIPEQREMIIGAAGTLAILTFFMTSKGDPWVLRLFGMIAAGVVVAFSFLMPEYADKLLSAGGLIAGASIFFNRSL